MKNRNPNGNGNGGGSTIDGPKSMSMKKKRNMNRLGGSGSGSGLSLHAFANAKSTNNQYNPALIKKKREFYQNAKYVNKYKKSLRQQNQGNNGLPSATRTPEDGNEETSGSRTNKMSYNKNNKKRKNSSHGLKEVYEKQWEEKEKARIEKEAAIQAKKEHREKAEAQRKAGRKEMFKRTKHGQPVMKYRIEHLLQSIQTSSSASIKPNQ